MANNATANVVPIIRCIKVKIIEWVMRGREPFLQLQE
jgi:hypothetical protein